jgi:cytochrome c551/c552
MDYKVTGGLPGRQGFPGLPAIVRSGLPLVLIAMGMLAVSCSNEATVSGDSTSGAEPKSDGSAIFQQNCATCHNMVKAATGPALAGVLQRWDYDTARLKAFIRNPGRMISEGDSLAVRSFEKYKPIVMPAFPNLSDDDLNKLITHF